MVRSILIACDGNICRSPIALGILGTLATGSLTIRSCGLRAREGLPAHPFAIETCDHNGIDLRMHRSRRVDEPLMREAELVLTMEVRQSDDLLKAYPWTRGKVWRLAEHLGRDLPDLMGQRIQSFEEFFETAKTSLEHWVEALGN